LFGLEFIGNAREKSGTAGISNEDLICTLSAFTAKSIAGFIQKNIDIRNLQIFASGGGANNTYIIDHLKKALSGVMIKNTEDIGINPDAKEAILFALLGNEALCGEPIAIGTNPVVLMGKFSFAV